MKEKNEDESDDILKLLGKKKESLARQLLGSDDDEDENENNNDNNNNNDSDSDGVVRRDLDRRPHGHVSDHDSKATREIKVEASERSDSELGEGEGDGEGEDSIFKTAFKKAAIETTAKKTRLDSSSSGSDSESDSLDHMDDGYDENGYGDEADTQRQ